MSLKSVDMIKKREGDFSPISLIQFYNTAKYFL